MGGVFQALSSAHCVEIWQWKSAQIVLKILFLTRRDLKSSARRVQIRFVALFEPKVFCLSLDMQHVTPHHLFTGFSNYNFSIVIACVKINENNENSFRIKR